MNKCDSPSELKRHFLYTLKENLIEIIKPEFFSDYRPIQSVFGIIKDYYSLYISIPPETYILDEVTKIEKNLTLKTIQLMFTPDANASEEFLKSSFKTWLAKKLQGEDVINMIEETRNGNISADYIQKVESILKIDEGESADEEDVLKGTPTIPEDVINQLPSILSRMVTNFTNVRERDVFLLAELVCLSAVFPTVSGIYDKFKLYPNLYGFIAAVAAGGKGAAKFAINSLSAYTKRMRDNYKNILESFDSNSKEPKPEEKFLNIGGDASAAGFIKELALNNEKGILLFETEADAISDHAKQDWGDYSTYLRKGYHHEEIKITRKDLRTSIETPKLSVMITGTLAQLVRLISNTENGLFSRFFYYTFKNDSIWRDPSAGSDVGLNFSKYATEVDEIIYLFENQDFDFFLNADQWKKFNSFFGSRLNELKIYNESDIEGTLYRLGTIAFRIMMILSILRTYEERILFAPQNKMINCSDIDLDSSLKLIDVFLKHAELISNNLSKSAHIVIRKNNKEQLFDSMSDVFRRADIKAQGKVRKISPATIDRLLQNLIAAGKLVKVDRFTYQKVK